MSEKTDIEQLLRSGTPVGFKPQGNSMHPTIVNGRDSVIIEPLGNRKLKRGDVALFRRSKDAPKYGGMLVLHRVHSVKKDGIYMVGDNEKEIEGPLADEQFIGIMTELIRKGKHISEKNLFYRFLTRSWLFVRPFRFIFTGKNRK
ncbi:MAG: S26 family signal peptidase [Lachnospiraceae bacterium]|nr:S26 family signal peptidase [Lachnospiraceae bacterium]